MHSNRARCGVAPARFARAKVLPRTLNTARAFIEAAEGISCGVLARWLGVDRTHAWKLANGVRSASEEQLAILLARRAGR